jgi:transcriptional regulator with XRE-family HTH domain
MSNEKAIQIRTRKLAVLLRDARLAAGRSADECAHALGMDLGEYARFEAGETAPSLPQLEALAFFLDTPLSHFWGSTSRSERTVSTETVDAIMNSIEAHRRSIGEKLAGMREDAGMSQEALAENSGVSLEDLQAVERGEGALPTPEFESLVSALGGSVNDFSGGPGAAGDWLRSKEAVDQFMEMPADLQEFVSRPYNRPYIDIALKLSTMEVNRLRSVAEGLLEITL